MTQMVEPSLCAGPKAFWSEWMGQGGAGGTKCRGVASECPSAPDRMTPGSAHSSD